MVNLGVVLFILGLNLAIHPHVNGRLLKVAVVLSMGYTITTQRLTKKVQDQPPSCLMRENAHRATRALRPSSGTFSEMEIYCTEQPDMEEFVWMFARMDESTSYKLPTEGKRPKIRFRIRRLSTCCPRRVTQRTNFPMVWVHSCICDAPSLQCLEGPGPPSSSPMQPVPTLKAPKLELRVQSIIWVTLVVLRAPRGTLAARAAADHSPSPA